jgi:SAM-dependent methyltransferase
VKSLRSIGRSLSWRVRRSRDYCKGVASKVAARITPAVKHEDFFPPIEAELGPFRHFFKGNVLNAGAGCRDIRHLVEGRLFNQDLSHGLHNANIDIYSPLHKIPMEEGFFDAIICNAVMEHVENPEDVMGEFRRVCKPGGVLYLGVPFMQPEHLSPTDSQRYTIDGLKSLVNRHGFDVIQAEGIHSVYTTLGWMFTEWSNGAAGFERFLVKCILLPYVQRRNRRSQLHVHSMASVYRVVARRRPA